MMKFVIKLRTIEDIKRFRTKIIGINMQLFAFQAFTVRKFATIIILDKIHREMRSAGFSEKIIKGTFIDNIELIGRKKARIFFRSEYFSATGFDVALAREEGTDDHDVIAGPGKVLPIPTSDGLIFRKKAHPDGILALFIVKNTVKQMTEPLQDEYNRQLNIWYEKNLEGIATIAS